MAMKRVPLLRITVLNSLIRLSNHQRINSSSISKRRDAQRVVTGEREAKTSSSSLTTVKEPRKARDTTERAAKENQEKEREALQE